DIVTWLWGGFSVDNPTLNRFYALHYLLPFLIFAVVFVHLWALHTVKSNNPLGIEPKKQQDTIPFHPYYTVKDLFGFGMFFLIYLAVVFFAPNWLGETDNYIPANSLVTPAHIVPEWYFLPYYAILRSVTINISIPFTGIVIIPAKLGGVIAMFGSILILFVLPWLDSSPIKSGRFRPIFKQLFVLFIVDCAVLTWVGANRPDEMLMMGPDMAIPYLMIGQVATLYYFGHFLVLLPLLARFEKPRPLPDSISAASSGQG
ncbi:MAG: cytochrome b N-terminal domain-containing protein, partial [Alphaproteobacteria bacterium]